MGGLQLVLSKTIELVLLNTIFSMAFLNNEYMTTFSSKTHACPFGQESTKPWSILKSWDITYTCWEDEFGV